MNAAMGEGGRSHGDLVLGKGEMGACREGERGKGYRDERSIEIDSGRDQEKISL